MSWLLGILGSKLKLDFATKRWPKVCATSFIPLMKAFKERETDSDNELISTHVSRLLDLCSKQAVSRNEAAAPVIMTHHLKFIIN